MRELPAKQLSLIDFKHRLGGFLKVTVGNIPSRIACQSLLLQSAVMNGNILTTDSKSDFTLQNTVTGRTLGSSSIGRRCRNI